MLEALVPDQRGSEDRGCPWSQVPANNSRERCNPATQRSDARLLHEPAVADDHRLTGQRGAAGAGEPDCEPRPGALLAAATERAAAGTEVDVRRLRCLANCTRGPSAAMRCNGSWTYVFGGLDATCAEALIEGARLLAGAADGILPWRGRPEILKRGLIARVPPIDFFEGTDE